MISGPPTTVTKLGHLVDDVTLIVSELATNAVHAKPYGEIRLTVFCLRTHVGVEVWDELPELPARRRPADVDDGQEDDFGGRGLNIVDILTDCWGVRPEDDGKTIWALVRLSENHPPAE